MTRVQIPVWSDRWMMGDRFGTVVKIVVRPEANREGTYKLARIRLDKSGKVVTFPLDDCEVLS